MMAKEVASELLPFLRIYNDGSAERLSNSPFVPSSPEDPETGVSSKDITISENPNISARVYLPKLTQSCSQKLPILFYTHGGGFCFESAFSLVETKLMNALVSEAKVVAISIEYRLAPEHALPIAYEDCWAALQWVASHSNGDGGNKEPWLTTYGDFDRVFIGGDSAGANIAHHTVMRAGKESLPGGVKIVGAFLTHPYFWGSKPIGSEVIAGAEREKLLPQSVWKFLCPSVPGGPDNPMINFVSPEAPSLAKLGCSRLLVSVAELDVLRDRGVLYYNAVKESGWKGEVELVEVEGEDHAFHILKYETENAKKMIKGLASFLLK
ncbi:2-hydroxyisoflavanone dehydratase-like [Melia azedarach]|uniref:2-hydroxyisoflavanone dehydratase-like n=1 Tax=Melia azedarach TaxID=155640 RepID=A0ACC1YG75_MELAZ|nr:2-hydroxyisoflavanone dehydratase-like [Melia azedarach]